LTDYHEQQTKLIAKNKCSPDQKIYPLPFNAYKLDESTSLQNKRTSLEKSSLKTKKQEPHNLHTLANSFERFDFNNKQTSNSPDLPSNEASSHTAENDDLNRFFK
jgi:hypothetical protein